MQVVHLCVIQERLHLLHVFNIGCFNSSGKVSILLQLCLERHKLHDKVKQQVRKSVGESEQQYEQIDIKRI